MAGQAEDDLIAELAKLMAQDAQGDRRGDAGPTTAKPFSVRIPGDSTIPPAAAPAPKPAAPISFPPTQAPEAPKPVGIRLPDPQSQPPGGAEGFSFNFDLGTTKPATVPVRAATPPRQVPPARAEQPARDSIADLIAAEFAVAPAAASPAPGPQPASPPTPEAIDRPAAEQSSKPAAQQPQPAPLTPAEPVEAAAAIPGKPARDAFEVPPVFGISTAAEAPKPARVEPHVDVVPPAPEPAKAAAPAAAPRQSPAGAEPEIDPVEEIENLIGRAMRVEYEQPAPPPPQPARPAPSPALRSLATPTLPQNQDRSRELSGADEAIFAAAQATGAQVGWVDAPEAPEPAPRSRKRPARIAQPRPREPRSFRMSRALAGPLVAVTLLLAAGFGLYWVLGLQRDTGPAPLLTADAAPVKEVPEAQPETAESQQSVVFNEMDGVTPGAEEQLVSRDQADINAVTQVPVAQPSTEGLANRKVRTLTVRPDGTIVSGEDTVAGSSMLPIARPNVPDVPGAQTASPELLANAPTASASPAASEPATDDPAGTSSPTPLPDTDPAVPSSTETSPATSEPEVAAPAATAPAVVPVEPGATVPVFDAAGNPIAGRTTVVPLQRPAGLSQAAPTGGSAEAPTSPVNALVPAPTQPTTAAANAAATAAEPLPAIAGATEVAAVQNNAPAYVQLASQRSEAEARSTAQNLVTRFGPLFGGANMEVQRVDLGARGIYYRVRVPAGSLEQANSICTNVKAAGGDCFTM